jgi:hypothetical protein
VLVLLLLRCGGRLVPGVFRGASMVTIRLSGLRAHRVHLGSGELRTAIDPRTGEQRNEEQDAGE